MAFHPSVWEIFLDDSLAPTELDPPTPNPTKDALSPVAGRPVARPLAAQPDAGVVTVEDSPTIKKELASIVDRPDKTLREKQAHMRFLQGRLIELSRAIEFEAHLFLQCLYMRCPILLILFQNMCNAYIYI